MRARRVSDRTAMGLALAVAVHLLTAAPAPAQVTTEFIEGRFQVRHNGELIMNTKEDFGAGGVRPEITVTNTPDGFDLHLLYRNDNPEPTLTGHIEFNGYELTGQIHQRLFRRASDETEIVLRDGGPRIFGNHYPSTMYSPVMTVRDTERTVGFSVHYPVLDHETGVFMKLRAIDQPLGGADWKAVIEWGSFTKEGWGGATYAVDKMDPGEERELTIAVRINEDPDDWFDTIQPYIDYFRQTYGDITYTPNPRAVRGFHMSQASNQSPSNTRGLGYGNRRADLHGWRDWADEIAGVRLDGFERVMMWAPSGLFADEDYNYPFLFASPLMEWEKAARTIGFLRGLAPRGVELGFWWGRSQFVMYGWDDPRAEVLDPDNPEHVERAFREIDAAARMGVRTVGLDAFTYLSAWEGVPWLIRLRERHPRMKFVTENSLADVWNQHAPTWMDNDRVFSRHDLADALFPTHETWVGVRFDLADIRALYGGGPLNDTQKLLEIQRIANLGYVPVVQDENIAIPTNLGARRR